VPERGRQRPAVDEARRDRRVHDVAARRRDEEELRKHRGFLESIVEEVPLMIFVKEARDLRFERLNRAGEMLLGIEREEMLARTTTTPSRRRRPTSSLRARCS
jgi:PAS domain-containing protein